MSEPESISTMLHRSFVPNGGGAGDYALAVALDQNNPNNAVRIASGQVVFVYPAANAQGSSSVANGRVTAPAAGAAIATTPSLAIGAYDIEVTAFITGTTAAQEINNIQLQQNAVNLGIVTVPVNGATGAVNNGVFRQRLNVTTAGALSARAIAAGTGGSIYAVSIDARRVQ